MRALVAAATAASILGLGWPATGAQDQRKSVNQKMDAWALYEHGAHLGPIDQALVGIEVVSKTSDGAAQSVRRGSGLVIRSDGFVVAPASLFGLGIAVAGQTETASTQAVAVVLHPGTPDERRVSAHPPRFIPKDLGYAVFKIGYIHTPALRVELPTALQPGDTVSLWSVPWDAHENRFLPAAHQDVKLAPDSKADKPGRVHLADGVSSLVPGAVAVAADGAGLGVACDQSISGVVDRFTSFSVLDEATNCVAAVPPPDQAAAPPADDSMVAVAGGPFQVPTDVLAEQPDMEGELIACVAPFKIDKKEVTNKDYLAFWNTYPEQRRAQLGFQSHYLPTGWSKSGEPFPASVAELPVIGVPYDGAVAYALSKGKRLPTPYEWCLAAFGPKGDQSLEWPSHYVEERRQVWERAVSMHYDYLRLHPELQHDNLFAPSPFVIPWVAASPVAQQAAAWSKQTCEQLTSPLWSEWHDPMYLLPGGSRDFDTSPYGALDMFLNASELVQPNPGTPTHGHPKFMEVDWEVQKPKENDRWIPRDIGNEAADVAMLPPLSRLYRRSLLSPSTQDLLMLESINELDRMLMPLAGWYVRMGDPGDNTASGFLTRAQNRSFFYLGQGENIYRSMPSHFRVEMGQPVPEQTDQFVSTGPQLYFVGPTGFRCAR